jgi:hypothetical protein
MLGPEAYKDFLATMRADRCKEYGLVGWREVAEWLTRMRFTRKPPVDATLRKWRNQFCLPITKACRSNNSGRGYVPFTTNLALHAWMATQSRALSLPRWHPFRLQVQKVAFSQNPSAIRMRRHRLTKLVASRVVQPSPPAASPPAAPLR